MRNNEAIKKTLTALRALIVKCDKCKGSRAKCVSDTFPYGIRRDPSEFLRNSDVELLMTHTDPTDLTIIRELCKFA